MAARTLGAARGQAGARRGAARASAEVLRPVRHAPDYWLFAVITVLVVFGLIAVYSSSYAYAAYEFDDTNYFIKRQALWAGVGLAVMVVVMNMDYRWLRVLAFPIMLAAIVALAAVLVVGDSVNGAQRWISVGPVGGQPSEIAKLAVLIYMSAWLAAKGDIVRDFSMGFGPFVFIVAFVGGLVMAEPDLGSTVMIAAITMTLFFVAGARLTHVLLLVVGALGAGAVLILTSGYRLDRLVSFTSAEADPSGLGFQTLQLLVAFGSGGLWGLGLGVSRQKFLYVPGSHTDGVMAIVGEELGFVGVMVVLALFAILLWRAALIAHRAADSFGSLLATGMIAWIGLQLLINVAGVTRMIPLTGIPLPLLSYGGSALASTLAGLGVLLSVSRYAALQRPEPAPRGAVRASDGAPSRAEGRGAR